MYVRIASQHVHESASSSATKTPQRCCLPTQVTVPFTQVSGTIAESQIAAESITDAQIIGMSASKLTGDALASQVSPVRKMRQTALAYCSML